MRTETKTLKAVPAKRIARLFVVCIGLPSFLAMASSCGGDYREAHYATLAEADKDRAIERGWIPYYLPASSTNILEFHRIEHSRTWCSFDFVPSDVDRLRKELTTVTALPEAVARIQRPNVSWWPVFLQGEVKTEELRRRGFDVYLNTRPGVPAFPNERLFYLFVVDWSAGHGYFYQAVGNV